MMNVLIVTRSFVREVNSLLDYAAHVNFPAKFFVIIPEGTELDYPGGNNVSQRKIYFAHRMRAACYGPSLFKDILAFRPDILHLFEEFSGLIAFQSLLFNRILERKSQVLLYSAENLPRNMHALFRLTMCYVINRSDAALVCSHGVKPILQAEGYAKPIEVFPLGVDTSRFYKFPVESLKTQLKLDEKFVLGYVGRLLAIKGVFLLIEMMQHLPENAHLLMVGSGPEEFQLRHKAAVLHVDHRIHFVGSIPYKELPRYINCMDIGVVPSQTTPYWKEQFGRVLVEFMSCEVPVIGSNSGSIPEVIGDVGYIFQENSLQGLIRMIHFLMQQPAKTEELGKLSRKRVIKCYSQDIMCEQVINMYQRLSHNALLFTDG
ncbi:hypothetical protein U27_02686 [Candidatus Vecturithrix granuli]|uniref:Glycosyl transferase group 1 n=1 Tax=Vecturithrix granuli TaxID=1499967 RepID=A0A081BTS3_VECG1|nr:hypothetical protein U27_02686 [Candidatus Vecturithrix granuli]